MVAILLLLRLVEQIDRQIDRYFRIVFKYVVDGGNIAVVEARESAECDAVGDVDNIGDGEDGHENKRDVDDDDDDDAK